MHHAVAIWAQGNCIFCAIIAAICQVFNMMHNAARKLADEFGAQVLDGRRSVLTKQGLQQYVEKIREFERKRMIARS